jgi:hypothetical protein
MDIDVETLEARLRARSPHGQLSLECGPGWADIIDRLDQVLSAIAPDYQILQVKEKFGGLRFYVDSRLDGSDANQRSELLYAAIRAAEHVAWQTCEETGRPGVLMVRNHWLRTLDPSSEQAAGFKVVMHADWHRGWAEGLEEGHVLDDGDLAEIRELVWRLSMFEMALGATRAALDGYQQP